MTEPPGVAEGEGPVEPVAADVYGPYGQLIKMLLPRSGSVAVYDADKELLWCSDGCERPDLRTLVEELADESSEYLSNRGTTRTVEGGGPAFLYALRGQLGQILGSVVVELAEDQNTVAKGSMVASLLRPVLDCLENRIDLERTVVEQEEEQENGDLELLLTVDDDGEAQSDALEHLVRHCVKHLDCVLGALVIPDKGLTICCAADPAVEAQGPTVLSKTHKHLLAWVQLNNRPMVVNHVAPDQSSSVPPFKILSCPVRDPNNQVTGLFGLFRAADAPNFELRDIRILEFMTRKAVHVLHSQFDALTGLMTRLAFERAVQTALDEPLPETGRALLHIDIDRLNVINDAFGYQAGDEVIERLAQIIRNLLGPTDVAGRLGGDRFAVFLPERSVAQAEELAEQLKDTMNQLGYLDGEDSVPVSISIGVAGCSTQSQPVSHALASAELASKRAKAEGGNSVEVYQEDKATLLKSRGDVFAFANLQQALKGNNFRLDAQPIHRLTDDGAAVAYEILVRMRNEEGELMAPDKFMAAAHRYHLMPALDRWVLCSTLDALKEKAELLPEGVMFTVNVSSQSLVNDGFREFLLEQLRGAGLRPELLCLEINESAAASQLDKAELFVQEVTALGFSTALDDFGCGLSSLAHLKRLPVQFLKIDGGFIRRILTDELAESMVLAIAQAAKTLGIKTVAEHVEQEAIASKLFELEVDFGQGFYFARPKALGRVLSDLIGVGEPARASAS